MADQIIPSKRSSSDKNGFPLSVVIGAVVAGSVFGPALAGNLAKALIFIVWAALHPLQALFSPIDDVELMVVVVSTLGWFLIMAALLMVGYLVKRLRASLGR